MLLLLLLKMLRMMIMKTMMVIMLLMMVAITSRLASIQEKLSHNQGRGFSRSCEWRISLWFFKDPSFTQFGFFSQPLAKLMLLRLVWFDSGFWRCPCFSQMRFCWWVNQKVKVNRKDPRLFIAFIQFLLGKPQFMSQSVNLRSGRQWTRNPLLNNFPLWKSMLAHVSRTVENDLSLGNEKGLG